MKKYTLFLNGSAVLSYQRFSTIEKYYNSYNTADNSVYVINNKTSEIVLNNEDNEEEEETNEVKQENIKPMKEVNFCGKFYVVYAGEHTSYIYVTNQKNGVIYYNYTNISKNNEITIEEDSENYNSFCSSILSNEYKYISIYYGWCLANLVDTVEGIKEELKNPDFSQAFDKEQYIEDVKNSLNESLEDLNKRKYILDNILNYGI